MTTYFSRHTEVLDVDNETRQRLWEEGRIAIHFPTDKRGEQPEDSSSVDPVDYSGLPGHSAMKALARLAAEGGYVCAQYHGW